MRRLAQWYLDDPHMMLAPGPNPHLHTHFEGYSKDVVRASGLRRLHLSSQACGWGCLLRAVMRLSQQALGTCPARFNLRTACKDQPG